MTIFAAALAGRLSESQREATLADVRQRTDALGKAVERQVQASFFALGALAESTEAQRGDLAGLYAHALRFLGRQSVGTSVALSDREGHILFISRRPFGEKLPDVGADDGSAQVFATGKPQVSDLLMGTVTSDPLTIVNVPIIRDGEVLYDLRLGIRPASLAQLLTEQKLPADWGAVLVDRKGRYIARTRAPQFVGSTAVAPLLEALRKSDQGVLDLTTAEGRVVSAAFQRLPSSGWAVVVGVPHDTLDAPARRLRAIAVLSGALALCAGATIAILLARRLSGQLGDAVTAATALGQGASPPPTRTNVKELAELGRAFTQAHFLLRQRGESLALAFEAARAAPWDYDIQADRFSWSPESYQLFGFGPENAPITAAEWLALLVTEDRERILEQGGRLHEAWLGGVRLEFRIVHPQDGVRWISAMGKAVHASPGQGPRIVGMTMDITALKTAQQAALAAQHEAEQANLSKSKFLASASHDMRQPVQAMVLFTSLLDEQLAGHPAAKVVGHIERAAMSLKGLLEGLVEVSSLDAGLVTPRPVDVLLAPLLQKIADQHRDAAREKGLDLKVLPGPFRVRTDPALLDKILCRLIDNSIKYTLNGRILVACRNRGPDVAIEVRDTGIGIPENQSQAIFEEFYQLANPERDRSKGLGLGLSVVQRLARLMGHPVRVHSMPGRGSCFIVLVPKAKGDDLPGI